jgi:2',3'-cyclic-nucleotide 2'-phosphodiesterase/3'-nucleotidase
LAASDYELAIFETSDLHCNIVPYDYYNDTSVESYGLAKIATLVRKLRKQYQNNILIDNGDLFQGNALADYMARLETSSSLTHPIYRVMNFLKYDLANLGNHDFNYGLDFLKKIVQQADFPYICSNVFCLDKSKANQQGQNLYPPTYFLEKKLGPQQTIKIGFLGLVPPQILVWDKHLLKDHLTVEDILKSAHFYTKKLKEQGADLVVVIAHSGILPLNYVPGTENATYEITKIKDVDAVLSGHAHALFPGGRLFENLEQQGIENKIGKINGKPVVMPGAWGSHLGVIRFSLKKTSNLWQVKDSFSEVYSVKNIKPDRQVLALVQREHQKVLTHFRSVIGHTHVHFHSWFSTLQPSLTSQFVQESALQYAQKLLAHTRWDTFPLLCAFAPLNTGNHGSSYINIPQGTLAMKDIFNLYPYDNELKVILINGLQLKEWLEFSAKVFLQIDVHFSDETSILNPLFPSFNFDCMLGVNYKIDITQPVGKRIKKLSYKNKTVSPNQEFLIVTNNYRAAGGGNFPNVKEIKVVLDTKVFYRKILTERVKKEKEIRMTLMRNWAFHPIKEFSHQKIYFETSLDSLNHHPSFLTVLSQNKQAHTVKYLVDLSFSKSS